MKRKYLNIIIFSFGLFIAASILSNVKIFAKTCTWNGSQSGEWSNQNNWNADCLGSMPQDGDDLVFPASVPNYVMNDFILDLHINSMDFHSSSYIVAGNTFFVGNSITTNGFRPLIQPDFTLTADTTIEGIITNSIDLNDNDLTLDTSGDIPEISNTISGNGSVFVIGGGTARLDGNNTFVGDVTVSGNSTLEFYHTAALSNSGVIINTGSTLYYRSPGNLTVSNDLYFSDDSTLTVEGDLNTFSGFITGYGILKVNVPVSTTLILSGGVSTDGLQKNGPGTLTLSGSTSNVMNGAVITDGSLHLNKSSGAFALTGEIDINGSVNETSLVNQDNNQISDSAQVFVSGGFALWDLNGYDETVSQLSVQAGNVDTNDGDLTASLIIMDGGLINSDAGKVILTGSQIAVDNLSESQGVINGDTLQFYQDVLITRLSPLSEPNDLLIESAIHSTHDLTIQGVYVSLSGDNSNLTGQINVGGIDSTQSILTALNAHPLGANGSSKTVINGNASLMIDSTYTSVNEILELNGTGVGLLSGENYGAVSFIGDHTNYTVSQIMNITANTSITLLSDNQVQFNGVQDISGGHEIIFRGPATPSNLPQVHMNDLFNGTNDPIVLAHIDMYLDSPAALHYTSTLTFDDISTLHLAANQVLAGISGGGYIYLGNHNLILNYDNRAEVYTGQILGSGSLVKGGSNNTGSLKITDAQQYFNGSLVINNGTVYVNADLVIGDTTVILDGGILAGTGTIAHLTVISGQIAPGNSPGIIEIDTNLILNPGTTLSMEITGPNAGTGYDQINVLGDVDLGGASLVLLIDPNFVPVVDSQINLIIATGTITGTYGNLPEGGKITSGNVVYQIHYTSNGVVLTVISNTLSNTGIDIPQYAIAFITVLSITSAFGIYRKYYIRK